MWPCPSHQALRIPIDWTGPYAGNPIETAGQASLGTQSSVNAAPKKSKIRSDPKIRSGSVMIRRYGDAENTVAGCMKVKMTDVCQRCDRETQTRRHLVRLQELRSWVSAKYRSQQRDGMGLEIMIHGRIPPTPVDPGIQDDARGRGANG